MAAAEDEDETFDPSVHDMDFEDGEDDDAFADADIAEERGSPPDLDDLGVAPLSPKKLTLRTNWREERQRAREAAAPPPRRPPEPQRPAIDIPFEPRKGNYIFAVGLPGSGKTVLQSHLLRFLFESGEYTTNPETPGGRMDFAFTETLAHWQECWEEGRFPDSTHVTRSDHFRYVVKPISEDVVKRDFRFGFVEISGEHLKHVKGRGGKPRLPESIHSFLKNKECRLVFLMVCNGANLSANDAFFRNFLDYFSLYPELRFRLATPVGVIVSDPEAATELLKEQTDMHKAAFEEGSYAFNPNHVIKEFLPQTYGKLKGWKRKPIVTGFFVGNIRIVDGEPRLEKPNYKDSRKLFGWVYRMLTRRLLSPNFQVFLDDD